MPGDRAQELVALEGVEADFALRGDRRGAGHVAQESDLPEVVSRAHLPEVFPVCGNVNLPRLDHVEEIGRATCREREDIKVCDVTSKKNETDGGDRVVTA